MHARPTSTHGSPDATSTETTAPAVPAATAGSRGHRLVGLFRRELDTDRWTWSDEVYRMHGFAPGEVVPSTGLVLSHRHPDDRSDLEGALAGAAEDGGAFSCVYRILDACGTAKVLGIVGGRGLDGEAPGVAVEGYFVDLTESHREAVDREATAAIEASSLSRSTIEQAKGVMMAALGVSENQAFAVLRRFSNDSNVPVREVADHLVSGFQSEPSPTLLADVRTRLAVIDPGVRGDATGPRGV